MNESKILRELQRLSISEYLLACREHGRQKLPERKRLEASNLFSLVTEWRSSTTLLAWELHRAIELAEDFLWAEHFIHTNPVPRYAAYSNIRVLDRYLLVGHQVSLAETLKRCKTALAILVRDWRDHETNAALLFPERYDFLNFSAEDVRERIRGLEELAKLTTRTNLPDVHTLDSMPTHKYRSDWIYYAVESDGAIGLCHLTGVPQSRYHDEYMFLRTIHISEVCFHAINETVRSAIRLANEKALDIAERCMGEANFFASFLVKLFALFPTMPYESFYDGFRLATGNASAIQSEKYQLMEKITRGLSETKRASLGKQPEGQIFAEWKLPENSTLAGLATLLSRDDEHGHTLLSLIGDLDRQLLMWRSRHLGIARRYLPPDTKGTGDEGVAYLEANIRNPTIRNDTTLPEPSEDGRLHLTAAIQIAARATDFYWCESYDVRSADLLANLREQRGKIGNIIRDDERRISTAIELYERFFSDHQRESPLTGQLNACRRDGIPTGDPVAELLLSCELANGVLIGIHDLSRTAGTLRMDISVDGESFENISGKQTRCRAGDWVIRDDKGIIASYFDGPGRRTAVSRDRVLQGETLESIGVLIMGVPGLEQERYHKAAEMISDFIGAYAAKQLWRAWGC